MLEPEPRHFGLIDAVLAAVALPRPTQPLLNDDHCLIHGPLMDAKQHPTAGLVLLGECGRQTLAGAERQVPVADPVLPAVLAHLLESNSTEKTANSTGSAFIS